MTNKSIFHLLTETVAVVIVIMTALSIAVSCRNSNSDYTTPRPGGYFRIARGDSSYTEYSTESGLKVRVNSAAIFETATDAASGNEWITVEYPAFNASIYCTYSRTTPADFSEQMKRRLARVQKNLKYRTLPKTRAIPGAKRVTNRLFYSTEEDAIPLQFISTDSTSYIFSGTVFIKSIFNQDSLAPVINYLTDDVITLLLNLKIYGDSTELKAK